MNTKRSAFPCFVFALSALTLFSCVGENSSSSVTDLPSLDSSSLDAPISSEETLPPNSSSSSDQEKPSSSPSLPGPSSSESIEEEKIKTIRFGENKYTSSASLDNQDFERDGLSVELLSQEKCYSDGIGSAVRVGSSKNAGSFTLSFSGGIKPASLAIYSFAYNETTPYALHLSLNGENFASGELSSTALSEEPSFLVPWGKELSTLSVSSSSRFCLAAIELRFGGDLPPTPPAPDSSDTSTAPDSSEPSTTLPPDASTSLPEVTLPEVGDYYQTIDFSLSGAALKSALSKRISSPYVDKGYSYAYTAYETTDTGKDGYIMDIYSNVKFDPVADHQGAPGKQNYKKEGDCYNREHTIPQSVFSERAPMKSDLHHLLPTDGYVNNRRSNYPHAYVNPSSVKYRSSNDTIVGTGDGRNHGYTSNCCEVIDEYKGDIARIYFYFVTRYEKELPGMGSFATFSKNTYPALASWAIATYLEWNDMDPISEKEIARNEAIFAIQKNRNPFVDVPDLAHRIWTI